MNATWMDKDLRWIAETHITHRRTALNTEDEREHCYYKWNSQCNLLCSFRGSVAWSQGPGMTGYPTPSPSSVWHTRWSWASPAEKPCWPGTPASATAWEKVSGLALCRCQGRDVRRINVLKGKIGSLSCSWNNTHQSIQLVVRYRVNFWVCNVYQEEQESQRAA